MWYGTAALPPLFRPLRGLPAPTGDVQPSRAALSLWERASSRMDHNSQTLLSIHLFRYQQHNLYYCTGVFRPSRLTNPISRIRMHQISADQYSYAYFECNSRVTQLTEPSSFNRTVSTVMDDRGGSLASVKSLPNPAISGRMKHHGTYPQFRSGF